MFAAADDHRLMIGCKTAQAAPDVAPGRLKVPRSNQPNFTDSSVPIGLEISCVQRAGTRNRVVHRSLKIICCRQTGIPMAVLHHVDHVYWPK